MSKDSALVRQWLLLMMLSRRMGVTVQELARELEVTEKTIRRDLDTFKSVGLPIEEKVGERGQKHWSVQLKNGQPEISFSMDEGLALYMGRRFLEPLAGTMFWEAAQNSFQKIRSCMPKKALEYLENMAGHLHHTSVGLSDYSKKADLIDELMEGIEKHKATIIHYQSLSATEPVEYEVYPYGLTYHRGSLYLIAQSRDHDKLLHFKVDRLEDAAAGPFTFEPPAEFDLQEHLANSFGVFQGDGDITVKVRFLPRVARYVAESQWHASQELVRQKDGSVLAEFHLSSIEEIMRWILSFGQHAIVLDPPALCEAIRQEIENMRTLYGGGETPRKTAGDGARLRTTKGMRVNR